MLLLDQYCRSKKLLVCPCTWLSFSYKRHADARSAWGFFWMLGTGCSLHLWKCSLFTFWIQVHVSFTLLRTMELNCTWSKECTIKALVISCCWKLFKEKEKLLKIAQNFLPSRPREVELDTSYICILTLKWWPFQETSIPAYEMHCTPCYYLALCKFDLMWVIEVTALIWKYLAYILHKRKWWCSVVLGSWKHYSFRKSKWATPWQVVPRIAGKYDI